MTEITEQIPIENDDLLNIRIHQCEICKYNNLPYIYRSKFEISKPNPKLLLKTYAKPYVYYNHTEDTDYISKIKDLPETLHSADSCEVVDGYIDDDAETRYLNSTPVSYLIVGKPEIGQTELAQLLSEQKKCVYISPESVLREEVENDTRAGKCIKYNLEAGRSIGPEIILRLVEKRIKSQSVQHRGFVISGFPMLKNELFQEDPISSESAVFNVQEIFEDLLPGEPIPDKPGSVSLVHQSEVSLSTNKDKEEIKEKEEEKDEEDEGDETKKKRKSVKFPSKKSEIHLSKDIDLGPSETTIVTHTEPFDALKDPEEQILFLLNLLGTPLIIIYVMSGSLDVHNKRSNYRYNIYLQREVFSPQKFDEAPQFKQQSNMSMFDDDNIKNFPSSDPAAYFIDGTAMKIQVQLPMHFRKSISTQLWQYKCHVHAILKKHIMEHNPQYVIKIDGRLSSQNMFAIIGDRLTMLAFQPVLLPEKFTEDEEFGEVATNIQSPPAETQTPEDAFSTLRGKMIIGPMYKYQLSNWGFKCPVALKEGRLVKGKTEYAVKFMNKLFFISSEEALIKFYRNPRPYLLPIMPNPTCRIWIIGPRCSGRSVVAKCLSFLFNCKILDPIILESIYMKRKEVDFLDKIRSAAIMEAQSQLNEIREQERKEKIEKWKEKSIELLTKAVDFKKDDSFVTEEMTVEQIASKEIERTVDELELLEELQEMCLPSTSNVDLLQELLKEPSTLIDYLPEELRGPVEPATIFDSFVYERVDDVINSVSIPDMSLSIEEKVEMFKTEIDQAEEEYSLIFQRLGGWIIDGMILNMEVIEKLDPDYIADDIICLTDEESDHIFLLTKFGKKNFETFRDYKEVFEKLKLASALDISYSVVSASSKMHFIDSVVSEVEDRVMSYVDSETTFEIINDERNRSYQEHLDEFKEDWQIVRTFVINKGIIPMEINVEYKPIPDLLKETVIEMENRYRKNATIMTEEDKAQEQIDYAEPLDGLGEGMFGEGGGGNPNFFKDNRRLGYTNMYCPVTFDRYYVLWKGKEEFAVTFEQHVYLLATEALMNEFVTNPRLYLKTGPPEEFPPARICVIGVPGGGKSTTAMELADNYGLHYLSYDTLILQFLNLPLNYDLEQIYRLDPNLNHTLLNHPEDLEMIRNYIEKDIPLHNDIIRKIITPLWFREPYKDVGFVLDNFPKRPSDLSVLFSNFLIPDIVIELHASQEESSMRILPIRFEQFRSEINEKRRIKELENEAIYNQWYAERIERLQILSQQKREQRKIEAVEQHIQNTKLLTTPVVSGIELGEIQEEMVEEEEKLVLLEEEEWFVYDELMEMEDLVEINIILDEEMPEPKFYDVWESEDETKQRILAAFDGDFNRDIEHIDNIRNGLQEGNIECTIVATDNASPEKVLYEIIRLVDQFRFRNKSIFERVYEISMDVAERLLYKGYYFMSKFGRTCPVQVFENINPIQMFLPGENTMTVFPLIYKRYIYFVYGEENRDKFIFDPLKYVLNDNYRFPLIPLRVAIIGPPKCGKTTLAKRFEKEFQLKLITKGSAIRYVQKNMKDSELTKNINFILDRGWSVTMEMVAKAVETLTMHSKSLSQGYILDGFPSTQQEMNHFRFLGIVPHIIIDIQTSMEKIEEYSATNLDRSPYPTFSFEYIKHLHEEWERNAHIFRYYIHKEYQNLYSVENLDSKWHFWNQAKLKTFEIMKEFQNYIIKKEFDNVIAVKSLCVTPSEFFIRQSVFMNYCPLCYYYDDYLLEGGPFPDRNCVLQYLHEYFYICERHQEQFIADPTKYIPPINDKLLPQDLPKIVVNERLEGAYEDGFCIVSFWDNQPKYVLLKGDVNYAVIYKGVVYLFCSECCMKKFLATPHIYYERIIHFKNPNPVDLCELRKLPTLGYLEQFAARILINAIIDVELRRPYFVGLNICNSAAIQIALYLKLNNPNTPKLIVPLYYEAKERCDERRERLKKCIAYFKGRLNPYVYYIEHYRPKIEPEDPDKKSIEFDIKKWMYSTMPEPEYCE